MKDKLACYDSREDNLRDLRRQLSTCEAKADQAEADAESRVDAITKAAAVMRKEKERADKR